MSKKPVSILSGFLGSGKTTLLNKVLREQKKAPYALIINEFGEIGLDADLVDSQSEFVKMDNGCLCCSLNKDLLETLLQLKDRDDYEAVILETTGLADPLSVAWTFLRPQLEERFRLSAIIVVVDCLHYEKMLLQAPETKIQIQQADIIYLSKTELCDSTQKEKCMSQILKINSKVRFVKNTDNNWQSLLFETERSDLEKTDSDHQHQDDYDSFSFSLDKKTIHLEDIEDIFENLEENIFRAKAIFKNKKDNRIYEIHSVCGRVDFTELKKTSGKRAVVFIGRNLKKIKEKYYKLIEAL